MSLEDGTFSGPVNFDSFDEGSLPDSPDVTTAGDQGTGGVAAPVETAAADVGQTSPPEPQEQETVDANGVATKVAAQPVEKLLEFVLGDSKTPISEMATVEWKVDGKSEKIPVKELLTNYAGKVAWDKRFSEVSLQRQQLANQAKEFESTRSRHKDLITNMHRSAAEGKVFDAVSAMLEMTGLSEKFNAREYVKNLRESLIEQAQQYAQLTPEQRAQKDTYEELEYLKSQHSRTKEQYAREQSERAYSERVAKAMGAVNATSEEFSKAQDWLTKEFAKSGRSTTELTPEFVANHVRDVRDYGTAKDAMTEAGLDPHQNNGLWDQAVLMLRANPDWTAKDLREVFSAAVSAKRAKSVNKKVASSPVPTAASAAAKSKGTAKPDPRLDFTNFTADDLRIA